MFCIITLTGLQSQIRPPSGGQILMPIHVCNISVGSDQTDRPKLPSLAKNTQIPSCGWEKLSKQETSNQLSISGVKTNVGPARDQARHFSVRRKPSSSCFFAPSANQSRHYKSHTYCLSNPKTKRRSLFIKTGTFLLSRLSGRHKHAVTAVFVRL